MTATFKIPQQQKIIIVGTGHDANMAAFSLSKATNPEQFSISVLGLSPKQQMPAPFSFADSLQAFEPHAYLPVLSEPQLVRNCHATFTHGIAFNGWAKPEAAYFQPFGSLGAALGPVSFLQIALRLRHHGTTVRLGDYSLAALAAQSGKFVPAVNDSRSVLASCQHGMHVDLQELAVQLGAAASSQGVMFPEDHFERCEFDDKGNISAIHTSTGQRLEADLFIDCSGQQTLLSHPHASSDWQDWSTWLPCNRLISVTINTDSAPPSYSHHLAGRGGWLQDIPLQGKAVFNAHYNDKSADENALIEQILRYSGNTDLQELYSGDLRAGRSAQAWQGNCIRLGTAAALIDPVAISNLQLLTTGIDRLTKLLPGDQDMTAVRKEYNRQMGLYFDHARDFAIMVYKLNGRHGERFWDQCRSLQLPDELEYKQRLYQSRGLVALYDEEPLEESNWLNLFDEHNIHPHQNSVLADGFSPQHLQDHLQKIRAVMLEALPKLPSHADYLAHIKRKQK